MCPEAETADVVVVVAAALLLLDVVDVLLVVEPA